MIRYQRVVIWFLVYALLVGVSAGYADKIFLKDGTVQESERVWQSQTYVHFILKGTQGVVIRYSKGIVDRVVIDGVEVVIHTEKSDGDAVADALLKPKETASDKSTISAGPKAEPKVATKPRVLIDPKFIHSHKGIGFYDPRRPLRYWASKNSKHRSLEGALNSLAQTYGQSVKWIERHMGEENDLGVIHKNLMALQMPEPELQAENLSAQPATGSQRPAKQKPVMLSAPDGQAETVTMPIADPDYRGVDFYNPRRKEKYWAGKGRRYNSLDDAVKALAGQYGVTVEWVESHMGDTNDLMQIHQNIQISLNPKK